MQVALDPTQEGPARVELPLAGPAQAGGAGPAGAHGKLDMVAYYRPGSAWDGNTAAQAAVEALFVEYEENLRTGGDFDAKSKSALMIKR